MTTAKQIKMANKFGILFILALVATNLIPLSNSNRAEFLSDWTLLPPEVNTSIVYKLPARAVDVHIWTPVYLNIEVKPGPNEIVQPIENLNGDAKIIAISDKEITLVNNSDDPIWVQVYAR